MRIHCFGITKDIVGESTLNLETVDNFTVRDLKEKLLSTYPAFADLQSLAIAVNEEYAEDDTRIEENDNVVLIPPVSGG